MEKRLLEIVDFCAKTDEHKNIVNKTMRARNSFSLIYLFLRIDTNR
jgi:hypothetical protein